MEGSKRYQVGGESCVTALRARSTNVLYSSYFYVVMTDTIRVQAIHPFQLVYFNTPEQ